MEERLAEKLEQENSLDFWRCVEMGGGWLAVIDWRPELEVTDQRSGFQEQIVKYAFVPVSRHFP